MASPSNNRDIPKLPDFSDIVKKLAADDQSSSLEPLDEIMRRVLEHLRRRNPYIDPVPKHLLPKDATMIKSSSERSNRGLVYSVPYHTDYKRWIVDYGKCTGAKFILKPSRRLEMKEEYCCDTRLCKGGIVVIKKEQGAVDLWTLHVEITGHTKHPAVTTCHSFADDIRGIIVDYIRDIMPIKDAQSLFHNREADLKEFRKSLCSRDAIRYQGIWETSLNVKVVYDLWRDVAVGHRRTLHEDEKQSLARWYSKLSNRGHLTCRIGNGQIFGFIVPACKETIGSARTLFIDKIEDANKEGGTLFTMFYLDLSNHKVMPLAHLFTPKAHSDGLQSWLVSLRDQLVHWNEPSSFLVACDPDLINALCTVFPKSKVLLCQSHVKEKWSQHLNWVLFEARQHSFHLLSKDLEQHMMTDLWTDMEKLLFIKRESDVAVALDQFMDKYSVNRTFIDGFWKPWLKTMDKTTWMSVYREDVEHGELDITTILTLWRRKIKSDNFGARRIDVLMHTLYEMDPIPQQPATRPNWRRASANTNMRQSQVGQEWEDQVRQERALELLEGVKQVSENQWSVLSSGKDRWYSVTNTKRGQLRQFLDHSTCSCMDFERRKRWCKHISAVSKYLQQTHHRPEIAGSTTGSQIQGMIAPRHSEEAIDLTQEDIASSDLDVVDLTQEEIDLNDLEFCSTQEEIPGDILGARQDDANQELQSIDQSQADIALSDLEVIDLTQEEIDPYDPDLDFTRENIRNIDDSWNEVQLADHSEFKRTIEERLDRIHKQLYGIRYMDDESLELIEHAVLGAIHHPNTQSKRQKL
ncbi:hypothetical protein BGX31_000097 [Mortierella sp. GBA43]|nr:hypothetical protein BGX31_000097 [Mortierella sp. GBA43]